MLTGNRSTTTDDSTVEADTSIRPLMTKAAPPSIRAETSTVSGSFMYAILSCLILWCFHFWLSVSLFVQRAIHNYRDPGITSRPPTEVLATIQTRIEGWPKLPRHVALVVPRTLVKYMTAGETLGILPGEPGIGNEEIALRRLAEWMCWCMAANVRQVSLYDDQGVLVTKMDRLQKVMTRAERRLFGSSAKRHTVRWLALDEEGLTCLSQGGIAAGDSGVGDGAEDTEPDFRIFLFSPSLGKEHMLRVARYYSSENTKEPDVDALEARMKIPNLVEPQLLITQDGIRSYPFWYLHHTEFHQITPEKADPNGIPKLDHLLEGLSQYAQCGQRFGK